MNKIFNWTIGSLFRTFGRIFAYLLVGLLLALFMQKNGLKLTDLIGIDRIYASEKTLDLKNYYVRMEERNIANTTWTASIPMGTNFDIDMSNTFLNALRGRVGSSQKFQAGVRYRVKFNVIISNINNYPNLYDRMSVNNVACAGSLTNSWNSDSDLIDSCQYVGKVLYNNNERAHFYFDIVPKTDIYGFQINFYFSSSNINYLYGPYIKNIQITSNPSVTYDDSEINAINNQTNTIIMNNNENTQQIIDSQKELMGTCYKNLLPKNYDFTSGNTYNGITITKNNDYSITFNGTATQDGFVNIMTIAGGTNYFNSDPTNWVSNSLCQSKGYCINLPTMEQTNNQGVGFTIQNGIIWMYTNTGKTIDLTWRPMLTQTNVIPNIYTPPQTEKCISKLDEQTNAINNQTNAINDINDSINDDNTSGATSSAGGFFSSFNTNTHGLTGIITAPLNAINSLTSKTCSPLVLPLPYVNQNLTLPCMRPIYDDNFGGFMDIYDVVVIGIVSYWILVRIFALVKDFKNPDHDEIEVMDL